MIDSEDVVTLTLNDAEIKKIANTATIVTPSTSNVSHQASIVLSSQDTLCVTCAKPATGVHSCIDCNSIVHAIDSMTKHTVAKCVV